MKILKVKLFYLTISIITILSLIGILYIETDSDLISLLPKNETVMKEIDRIKELSNEFDDQQFFFIAVEGGAFTLEKIETLKSLCRDLDKIPFVESTINPFNGNFFKKLGTTFIFGQNGYAKVPKSDVEMDNFLSHLYNNRSLLGCVISYDKKIAGIILRIDPNYKIPKDIKLSLFSWIGSTLFGKKNELDRITSVYAAHEIESTANKYSGIFNIHYSGVPFFAAKAELYMCRDMLFFMIPSILLMILTFFFNFRSLRGGNSSFFINCT